MPEIIVKLKSGRYPIVVGSGIARWLPPLVERNVEGGRLFVFYDAQFYALHGRRLHSQLKRVDRRATEMVIPSGEKSKSASVLNRIYSFLLDEKVSRSDFIIAVGGGVTSDLVGYAAATTLRGIRWGVVPTTLLGMVDAGIGGKTGINHRAGKNLIGAFWQPRFVFCDTDFLGTLAVRHLVAGLGEIVKYAGLMGERMLTPLESYLARGDLYHGRRLARLVSLSAACKADIVARDEREQSERMLLNLGHTFGHAIESSLGYGRLLHGEAVLLGLWGAVELSCLTKPARRDSLSGYRDLIEGLMQCVPKRKIDADRLLEAITIDKKRSRRGLNYVLLERPGRPFISAAVRPSIVKEAVRAMLRMYAVTGGANA